MGLFDKLFNKNEVPTFEDTDIVSPVTGKMIPANEISDAVFAQEMMGQTIGIIPSEGTVVSPVNGKIVTMFPTGHAFGVMTNDGNGFLVHIGIDTVSMNGKGFKTFVKQGDKVKAGQKIVTVDLNEVTKAGYDTTVMLIVTDKSSNDYKVNYIDLKEVLKAEKINK